MRIRGNGSQTFTIQSVVDELQRLYLTDRDRRNQFMLNGTLHPNFDIIVNGAILKRSDFTRHPVYKDMEVVI